MDHRVSDSGVGEADNKHCSSDVDGKPKWMGWDALASGEGGGSPSSVSMSFRRILSVLALHHQGNCRPRSTGESHVLSLTIAAGSSNITVSPTPAAAPLKMFLLGLLLLRLGQPQNRDGRFVVMLLLLIDGIHTTWWKPCNNSSKI